MVVSFLISYLSEELVCFENFAFSHNVYFWNLIGRNRSEHANTVLSPLFVGNQF